MKWNKNTKILIFVVAILLIVLVTYLFLDKKQQQTQQIEEENKRLSEIVEKFNEKNIIDYYEGKNVEVKAKSSSSILYLYYNQTEAEKSYSFELKESILKSKETVNEVIIGHLLDTLLVLKEENSAYSFLGPINNHTILDYTLEEDGIEFRKEQNGYHITINLDKELIVKDFLDVIINVKDYQSQILNIEYNGNIYHQKGYILYKEEIDSNQNQVVTFAQYKDCNLENLRQSIANYLEVSKGTKVKENFLSEVSNEDLLVQSATRDNYELNNSYVIFKEELTDECFDYYLSNNYRVVTLITDTK